MRPRFPQYFVLQCKRMLRQLPATLLVTVLLVGSAALLGSALLNKSSSDTQVTRVNVGVIGDFENEYLGMGFAALKSMDPSRYSIEFLVFDTEDAARADLLRGRIGAYVRIPDTFVDSIRRGRIEPIRYVALSGSASLGTTLTDEIVAALGEMLSATQDAVYGTQALVEDRVPGTQSWKAGDALGARFIEQALDRESLFETETLRSPTGIGLSESLLCGVLVLFLMLWGITASGVFARREAELGGMLYARGMGPAGQVAAELGAYLALLLFTLLLVGVPAMLLLKGSDLSALGIRLTDVLAQSLLLRLIAAAVMAGALQFLLYEMASGVIQGVLLQFLVAVALGYASGCLYPLRFFPEAMQAVAQWLPTGCAISLLGAGFKGSGGLLPGLCLAVYTALFIAAAIRLRHRRLTRPGL